MFSIKMLYIKQFYAPLIKHSPFSLKRFSNFFEEGIEVPKNDLKGGYHFLHKQGCKEGVERGVGGVCTYIKTNDTPPSGHFQVPLSPFEKKGGSHYEYQLCCTEIHWK